MAVQIKNQIEVDLGVVVPMIQILQGPSLNELVARDPGGFPGSRR